MLFLYLVSRIILFIYLVSKKKKQYIDEVGEIRQ